MASATITSPKCSVCASPHRVEIDHILAAGGEIAATSRRFGLGRESVRRHWLAHISDAFKAAVKAGPFGSEENLKRLVAEGQVSNLEALQAYRAMLNVRILANAEIGADDKLVPLIREAQANVALNAKITGDLAPTKSELTVSLTQDPRTVAFVMEITNLARRHPEMKADVMRIVRKCFSDEAAPQLLDVSPGAAGA